jgi:DNA-binding response OmpR family regulator
VLRLSSTVSNKVLCVDQDSYLTDLLHYALTRDGHTVELAHTGAEALRAVETRLPNLVVLDPQLPDLDGFTLCGRLRRALHLPVVMLVTGARDADVIKAFESGADDCLAKPFSMQILSCRIGAILRRSTQATSLSGPIRIIYPLGSGTFHAEEHVVTGRLGRVRLTATQGKMLRLLLENEGRVLSAEQMIAKLWPYETESDVNVVKSHVSNLRKSLAAALGDEAVIRTVAGVGYTMEKALLEQTAV